MFHEWREKHNNYVYSSKSNALIKLFLTLHNTSKKRDNPMKLPPVAYMNYGSSKIIHYMAWKMNVHHRLKLEDFNPICQKNERRLSGCSSLLSCDGRLLLTKVVFSALTIFFMSTLALPASTIEQINKYLRHLFWRKFGQEQQGPALISWKKVCQLKDEGGLGILDIALHSKTLLMKNLHKLFNKEDLSWVKLI